MIFQSYFIKKKIQDLAKNTSIRKSRFCSLNEAKDFLIVFNIKDKEQILPCVEQLKELNKKISIGVFIPKKLKILTETDPSWLQIKEDEFGSNGLPSPPLCEQFNTISVDILIDLTRADDYAMHYLQVLHPASFKVGNKSSLRNLFDLTVTMGANDDIPQFFRQHILFYLQTIRSR
ncbi:MAG: hypothetical protein LBS05_03900 [Tannerellaceae bacterium]|jgi:hypothetical protein|nr:hypothetical protein [Tannerellaceae bacterium]